MTRPAERASNDVRFDSHRVLLKTLLEYRAGTLPLPRIPMARDLTLPADIRRDPAEEPPEAPRRVLLTGATGFLGGFLLEALLRRPGVEVTCVVRAPTDAAGAARL